MRPTLARVAPALAASCLVVAGCASSAAPAASTAGASPAAVSSIASTPPAAASSIPAATSPASPTTSLSSPLTVERQQGMAEAGRLLALTDVPPGSVAVSAVPVSGLAGPVTGAPVTSSLLDDVGYWQVPMPFAAAVAWMTSHPPRGLTASGSSSGGDASNVQIDGVEYAEPDTAVWVNAVLEVGVASGSATTSYIRADGLLEVVDHVPVPDDAAGPRLRVTVTAGCPSRNQHDVGVTNPGSDLRTALLPATAPTAGLICRYSGSGGKALTSQRLDASGAHQLATAVGTAQLAHLDDVETNCPMDDGSAIVFALAYPGRADVDLWWHSTGCQSIANGSISGNPGDALIPFGGAPTQSLLPVQSPGATQLPLPKPSPVSPVPIMKQSPPAA